MGLMLGGSMENGWRIGVFRAKEGPKRLFVRGYCPECVGRRRVDGSFVAQKFVVRLPSFWGGFLRGLVLGESCSSRRGICLEHFRDGGRLV
jgi:hypothetical protein